MRDEMCYPSRDTVFGTWSLFASSRLLIYISIYRNRHFAPPKRPLNVGGKREKRSRLVKVYELLHQHRINLNRQIRTHGHMAAATGSFCIYCILRGGAVELITEEYIEAVSLHNCSTRSLVIDIFHGPKIRTFSTREEDKNLVRAYAVIRQFCQHTKGSICHLPSFCCLETIGEFISWLKQQACCKRDRSLLHRRVIRQIVFRCGGVVGIIRQSLELQQNSPLFIAIHRHKFSR